MTGRISPNTPPGSIPEGALAARALANTGPASPGLPEGVWRDAFLELIIAAHRADLRAADQCVLRFYASQTRPADWSTPGRGPVCYVGQLNTAERLGFDRKTVYRAERRLEALGLIEVNALANGHRRGPRGLRVESAPLGVSFAPAIHRYDEIHALKQAIDLERERLAALRYRVSGLQTRLRITLRDAPISDTFIETIASEAAALPRRIARIWDAELLENLEREFQGLLDDLIEHIDAHQHVGNVCDSECLDPKMSHKGDIDVPLHIYTTTNTSSVPCTPHGDGRTGAKAPETNIAEPAPAGKRLENKPECNARPVNPQPDHDQTGSPPVNWTIAQLQGAASEMFRACITEQIRESERITSETLADAAADMAAILGINHSAWIDACQVMGRFDAALAVLVIDRNRSHPVTPVHSPGGALRAMTNRARSGTLNIDASIFAILRRTDDDHRRPN